MINIKENNENGYSKEYFNNDSFNRGKSETYYDTAYSLLIQEILKHNSKILEIGCSHGNLLKKLENDYTTYGIDISSYAIEEAKKNCSKTILEICNFEDQNCFDNTNFDLIIAIDVFEHFYEPQKVIKRCYQLLNKNGYLIIKIPNKSSIVLNLLKILNKETLWNCYKDPTHFSLLELKDWVKLFKDNNFLVKVTPSPPTGFLKNLLKKRASFFFNKFNLKSLNETITLVGKK